MPEAGRVITGSAGGLRLSAPGSGTRPLSDKVKQALFSLLAAERDDVWEHPMLDLFAGSGAAGIEALSRGAPGAVFVERDGRAARVIAANLERTGVGDRARIVRTDVAAFLASPAADVVEAPFGSVVIDPPYDQADDLAASLRRLGASSSGWLDEAACVAAKHFWRDEPAASIGHLRCARRRRFGETMLSVYRLEAELHAGGT